MGTSLMGSSTEDKKASSVQSNASAVLSSNQSQSQSILAII